MNKVTLAILASAVILLSSCSKEKCSKDSKGKKYDKGCIECTSSEFENPSSLAEGVEIILVEPLVQESDNCYSKGYVKYVKGGQTIAMVYYGKEKDYKIAYKTLCPDGDCKEEGDWCKFEQACGASQPK